MHIIARKTRVKEGRAECTQFGPSRPFPEKARPRRAHCDQWVGSGARLAARDLICVKPVGGWWKERSKAEVCEQQARYALVVTLASPDLEIDLHTPIAAEIVPQVPVEIER